MAISDARALSRSCSISFCFFSTRSFIVVLSAASSRSLPCNSLLRPSISRCRVRILASCSSSTAPLFRMLSLSVMPPPLNCCGKLRHLLLGTAGLRRPALMRARCRLQEARAAAARALRVSRQADGSRWKRSSESRHRGQACRQALPSTGFPGHEAGETSAKPQAPKTDSALSGEKPSLVWCD